jgi:hypothetical protein
MHFFYLDEAGCTGTDLEAAQQPIFVLGGISVRDEGWVKTTREFERVITQYFAPEPVPTGFELHSNELLSPNGEGFFEGHNRERRNQLALDMLELISQRSHHAHYVALSKDKLRDAADGTEHATFNCRVPYLLGFDYITTVVNEHVKSRLGRSARGIIIIDEKEQFEADIASITRFRRFEVVPAQRVKHVVEFSYSIDSRKHPMIQMSDLVVFCIKKFLEVDQGHRDEWPAAAKQFFAQCYNLIQPRLIRNKLMDQPGIHARKVNPVVRAAAVLPRRTWKSHYGL